MTVLCCCFSVLDDTQQICLTYNTQICLTYNICMNLYCKNHYCRTFFVFDGNPIAQIIVIFDFSFSKHFFLKIFKKIS